MKKEYKAPQLEVTVVRLQRIIMSSQLYMALPGQNDADNETDSYD